MRISFKFLKPRLTSIIPTIIIFSLPILKERVRLPEGGYEIFRFRPIALIASYFQEQEWYPFFLMVGLFLFIYLAISLVIAIIKSQIKPS